MRSARIKNDDRRLSFDLEGVHNRGKTRILIFEAARCSLLLHPLGIRVLAYAGLLRHFQFLGHLLDFRREADVDFELVAHGVGRA